MHEGDERTSRMPICWARSGQTLPMKTWRIRLVGRDGGAITVTTGAKRYLFALAGIALGDGQGVGIGFKDRVQLGIELGDAREIRGADRA